MNTIKLCLGLWLLGWSLGTISQAQESISPLQTEVLQQLDFGSVQVGSFGGTISLSASAHALESTTGGVYAPTNSHRQAAQLRLGGQANTMVYISVHQSINLEAENTTGSPLQLQLQLNSPLRHLGATGTITDVYIGGTLTIAPNQSAANYQGQFKLTVDYQ